MVRTNFLVATAIFCSVSAAFAQAPTDGFFVEHPVLQFLEKGLPSSATIAIPPDPAQGRHVVTDAELRVAFSLVLSDFLAPPSTFAGKAAALISEVCRYRPAQTPQWIAVATDALLAHSLPTAGKDLEGAVAAAVAANPQLAPVAVRQALRRITVHFEAFTRADAEVGRRLAANALLAAITAVKAGENPVPRIKEITQQALEEAVAQQSNALVIETMAAAMKGGSGLPGFIVGDFARLGFAQYSQSKQQAGIICAGALKGAGAEAASTIKDQAALNLPVTFAAYTTIVCNAFTEAAATPAGSAFDIARFITLNNADYIPAAMIGAIAGNPAAAAEMLRGGLNRDLVLHGRATTREIVAAAVAASEERAPELAAAAIGHGDLAEGNAAAQIAEGLARGTPAEGIGAALAAQLQAQEKTAAEVKATVAGAVAGAVAGDKLRALSAIAATAAAAPNFAADVLDQMLISAPPERQYAGVFGVLAVSRQEAPALLERALHSGDLVANQQNAVVAGGRLILEIQANPIRSLTSVRRLLNEPANSSSGLTEAIVLAASQANPRGAPAIAAAAAAATEVSPETLIAAASGPGATTEARLARAVETTLQLKGRTFDLFRCVRQQISDDPAAAPEIVTGAMAAAPALGHVIGQAAALAAPGALAQIVPRLFAFATIPTGDDAREVFAALAAGAIRGALDAEEDAGAESRDVTEVVAASVKSVIALKRDPASALAPDESQLIAAVISAATRAAGRHALGIARIAARTARALSSTSAGADVIRDAVLAANPPTSAGKIADAVNAGLAEADAQIRAADVRALIDYAFDSLTGAPMTSFLDL